MREMRKRKGCLVKIRSKVVEAEALWWTGRNVSEAKEFVGKQAVTGGDGLMLPHEMTPNNDYVMLWVEKSKAWCAMPTPGWIIREADGSGFYPCTPEAFNERWEVAE